MQKVVQSTAFIASSSLAPSSFFQFWEEVKVSGSQVRRIGWDFDKLESTFLDSNHGHSDHVCQSIVLVEEHSSCQLFTPTLLDFFAIAVSEDHIVGAGGGVTLAHQQHSFCIPENGGHHQLVLASLGGEEPRCFHCFNCCFISGWK